MKQICTQIAFFCLLIIGQTVYAQTSLTITKTNPGPTPGYGAADSVKAANGFSSTNTGTFHDFAPFQTDTITSSWYYYPAPQTIINFVFSTSCANSGVDATPKVLIITANGDTLSASASQNFKGASTDYYFTFNLGTTIPANTNFKIAVIMDLGPKAISANTFATNALRATAAAPLPVKFAGFYAKNNNGYTSLTWNVATELNVSGYEVQRSIDGSNFSKIGFISATNSPSYSFVDSKAGDIIYYRIKSIDVDGKYSYSIILNLKGLQSDVVMKAFPMPVQSGLTVQHSVANSDSKLEIISADGRMFKALLLAKGSQQTSVDLSSAKSGVYVVRFVNGANIQTTKIIKQ